MNAEELTITNNAVNAGVEPVGGGGILTRGGRLWLNRSVLVGNSASGSTARGGALYSLQSGFMRVGNTVIRGNTAVSGGGVFVRDGTSDFHNVTVVGNTASGNGGGFHVSDDRAGTVVQLYNSVVWFNSGGMEADVLEFGAGVASGGTNLIGGTCPGGVTNCLLGTPILSGDALASGSPGINQGVNADHAPFDVSLATGELWTWTVPSVMRARSTWARTNSCAPVR